MALVNFHSLKEEKGKQFYFISKPQKKITEGLGHTYDPQTTGIWVWARKHPRNPQLTILFFDTEGCDSPHIPPAYDWSLNAIALVLSNYFIYQSKGDITNSSSERSFFLIQYKKKKVNLKNKKKGCHLF